MSVISIDTLNTDYSGQLTIDGKLSFKKVLLVKTDSSGLEGIADVMSNANVCAFNTFVSPTVEDIGYAIPRDVIVSVYDDVNHLYKVELNYDNDPATIESKSIGSERKPWQKPATISYDAIFIEKAFTKDLSSPSKLVQNPVGDYYDPQPTRTLTRPIIRVSNSRETFSPSKIKTLINTINDASITIDGQSYAAGKLKMNKITATKQFLGEDSGTPKSYYNIEYEIETLANEETDTFDLVLVETGWRAKDDTDGDKIKIIKGEDDQPKTTPSLLDSSGYVTTNEYTKTYKMYASATWTAGDFT